MISNPLNHGEAPLRDVPAVQEELSPGLRMLKQYPLLPAFTSQYTITEELGAGGFGFVVGAIHQTTDIKVAVKFLFKDKIPRSQLVVDAVMGCVPREAYILNRVRHPGIVKYLDLFQDQCFYYMVMELHGDPWADYPTTRKCRDLFESIEKAGTFNELQTAHILYQLLDILMYLQSVNVYHRDIKDENIVIDSKLAIKLVDFGCAVVTPTRGSCTFQHFHGTAAYASPEILRGDIYRADLADVWAIGILLHTMLTGSSPFHTPQEVMESTFTPPSNCSPVLADLLQGMLNPCPLRRLSFHDIKNHPFLAHLC